MDNQRKLVKPLRKNKDNQGISKAIEEAQEYNKSLFEEAQAGDQELLNYFLTEYHCKVYTQEEIDLLNLLTNGGSRKLGESKEPDLFKVKKGEKKVFINLPTLRGSYYSAELCSLSSLREKYYLSRCLPLGEKWKENWILKLDDEKGFKPLFCTRGW